MSFPLTVLNCTSKGGLVHTVRNQENIGLLIVLNGEAASLTVFTTICPQEQQTRNNLIVKDS